MSVRESARPQSPQSGRRVQVTSSVTSDDARTTRHVQTTFLSAPPDDGAPSRSMPTSFSFPGDGSGTFGRSVPRDDSGLSIVSLGRGRPSDSGYGTDSPASLSAGALRFRFGSIEGTDDMALSPSSVGVQVEPEELDFDLGLNDDDDYDDDDVFLDVVPEEEVDGDDEFTEPAFPRQPAVVQQRDVVDGPGVWHGGSDGQTDTSTEEDEDSPASSGGSGSSSNPIAIPRPLRTEALEYAVALAYTPPHYAQGGMPTAGSSAILLARGSLRQEGALWSLTQAQLSRGPNSLAVRRSALFTATSHHRNGLQRIQLEEPYRRHSDGVDPRLAPGGHVSGRPGGASSVTPRSAPPATGRRCQSESAAHLEQQFGQELRRISDEFHMSYQCGGRAIPGRVRDTSSGGIPHSSSLPEARGRRGSLVDRFIGFFSTTPTTPPASHDDEDAVNSNVNNDVFQSRRRAHSEILMATGVMPGGFGRQESLWSTSSMGSSSPEASPERQLSSGGRQVDYDELDGGSSRQGDDEDDDEHHAIFHLSTEQ